MSDRMCTDYNWVRDEIERWTFMPGWSFAVNPAPDLLMGVYAAELTIQAVVPNSYPPHLPGPVQTRVVVPPYLKTEMFAQWFRGQIHDLMLHETDEWIRRDGAMLFNPHAGEA